MTQQVRTRYRNHRKAAWGLALLLVAAIATVTIPLASGAPTKTLKFDPQPPFAMQKGALATPVSVAVFQGGQTMNSQGQTPTLSTTGAGTIDDNFTVSGPQYDGTTKHWTWQVTPNSNALSGFYIFTATLGTLEPATATVRVAEFVCPPSCDNTSNLTDTDTAPGKLKIAANTLATAVALDFQTGLDPVPDGCNTDLGHPWNRTSIDTDADGDGDIFFPAVALDFNWGSQMLQVTYLIKNSDWILTNAARGNNDIEFCAEARHQIDTAENGFPPPTGTGVPFDGKYGPATWDPDTEMFSGVLTTVSNPSKVKTNGTGSPAVCGRGNVDISGETWRTWTVCIPKDWDWKMG
jgi:hypothetical protein